MCWNVKLFKNGGLFNIGAFAALFEFLMGLLFWNDTPSSTTSYQANKLSFTP